MFGFAAEAFHSYALVFRATTLCFRSDGQGFDAHGSNGLRRVFFVAKRRAKGLTRRRAQQTRNSARRKLHNWCKKTSFATSCQLMVASACNHAVACHGFIIYIYIYIKNIFSNVQCHLNSAIQAAVACHGVYMLIIAISMMRSIEKNTTDASK